jgi:arginyl-tRNA synthetase
MISLKSRLKTKIFERLKGKYSLDLSDIEINYTPQLNMGDLALALPLQLAKKTKAPPRQLAQEMVSLLSSLPGINKIEIAGQGYINFFIDREKFFIRQLRTLDSSALTPEESKVIIEHTNINPNKAAHIGHLRNACLGDTLGRCMKYKGEEVEIQNYIDDTGVQVVDIVFGLMEMEKKTLEDVKRIEGKFDFYCWDLYTRVSSYLEAHPEARERKAEILKRIEHNENPEAEMAHRVSRRILRAHLQTMRRIGVSYDLLPCESSILGLKFWEEAFSHLKEKKAVSLAQKGINKGCWVMKLEGDEEKEKIIVRSDGTVTYVGKDIAYQLWKFGLLEKDFYYKPFLHEDGKTIWITTDSPASGAPSFGKGSLVYNVIDIRQSYLQQVVIQGLKSLKYLEQAQKSIHFSYEMVALSPKSLKELNLEVSEEDRGKSFHEVSGRKGLGIKADNLLDRLEEKALEEVEKRNPHLRSDQKAEIAWRIACGALRYFMLKFARNSLIVFDFEDALSFEGETGPYLQYTVVRINSIFRKLKDEEAFGEEDLQKLLSKQIFPFSLLSNKERDDFWDMVLYASQFEEEVLHSIRSLEFSHLAKFAFNLCQKFNSYYHVYPVKAEKDEEIKSMRILTIYYVREILKSALELMGIPQPERM